MANCTGANAQYAAADAGGTAECMNACALMATTGSAGNTLGCRYVHAGYAGTMGVVPHCWHAGPYGYGGCGSECEGFCSLATGWCSPDGGFDSGAPPYASQSACTTACAGFAKIDNADGGGNFDGGFNAAGPTGGNTLDCREYHLGASLHSHGAMDQQFHCPHVAAASATCM
jgi:hypothetical protein